MWESNVYGIRVRKMDFGIEFGPHDRYEYEVLTIDAQGKEDAIPGTFTNYAKAADRARHIARIVKTITGRRYTIGKSPIERLGEQNHAKNNQLKNKLEDKEAKLALALQRRRFDQECANRNPGGARQGKCR